MGASGRTVTLIPEGIWKWMRKYLFWQFGPPACCSAVEGKQKPRGRKEQLPTSFLPNQVTCHPLLGRTKRMFVFGIAASSGIWKCPRRYNQECLSWRIWTLHQPLSFHKWERDSQLPFPSAGSTFSQAGSSQTSVLLAPLSH